MATVLRPDRRAPTRPRSSTDAVKALARRLTPRDRWLMREIWRHRTLTTHQLATIGFTSYNTAKDRLAILYALRALDRLRPWRPHGGAPWHYILDQPGAEILAAEQSQSLREFGYRRDRALAAVTSSRLEHTIGVNQIYTDLYSYSRDPAHHAHLEWWTEAECAWHYGDIVRPDAAGRWSNGARSIDFFLEYDTGTEPLRRLTAKLDTYAELAELAQTRGIVLIYLPTQRREAHLRRALGAHPPVPVATATHGGHPADAVWVRVDDVHLHPRHLIDLAPQAAAEQPALPGLAGVEDG